MRSTAEQSLPQPAPAHFADADAARSAALAFDLRRLPADYFANPYPYYHALRAHAPVHRLPDGSYFLSRYADCVAVYKDAACSPPTKSASSSPSTATACSTAPHHQPRLQRSAAAYARAQDHRRRLHAARHRRHGAAGDCLVDGLLDRMAAKGGADLIADLAAAVPVEVIGNLLAVPTRGARTAAGLVAGDPGRARAGADAPSSSGAARRRCADFSPTCETWSPIAARIRAIPSATC